MKKAFSMITAIIFILLVSAVGVSILQTSKSTISFATRAYIKEQAELILEGAKEVAVDEWLKSNAKRYAGIFTNASIGGITQYYYYPNTEAPQYCITIHYIQPKEVDKLTEFDRNTILARITVDTVCNDMDKKVKGLLGNIAQIKLVKYFMIGN